MANLDGNVRIGIKAEHAVKGLLVVADAELLPPSAFIELCNALDTFPTVLLSSFFRLGILNVSVHKMKLEIDLFSVGG